VASGDACAPTTLRFCFVEIFFMKENSEFQPKQWYSRGYLPHFDDGISPQFVTMRLFDSLPQKVLDEWRGELKSLGNEGEIERRKRIEKYLDLGYGSCFLREKKVAEMMQNSLLFHDGAKYKLIAWTIMPNHVHFLMTRFAGFEMEEIMHSIKSYTAHEANKILKRAGNFWQHESFDRFIRSAEHFANVVKYIERNPVKAGLCERKTDWIYSSAHYYKNAPESKS
jgi:REP element-mobilizing transposase RayT